MRNRRFTFVTAIVLASVTGCVAPSSHPEQMRDFAEPVTAPLCPKGTTVEGVDVSAFQQTVNWNAVKASGRAFAIARISVGLAPEDPTFASNWSGIKAAGLIRGAYQYFRADDDAVAQANVVAAAVGRLGPQDLPVMLDIETMRGVSATALVSAVHRWIDVVRAKTGKKPMIYTGAYFWDDNVKSADFAGFPLAISWYGVRCPGMPAPWHGWTIHQYSETGTVPGVGHNPTDLDVFNGTLAELKAFAAEADDPPPGNADCSVHTDHELHCSNALASMYAQPTAASDIVDELRTTYSWFDCWASGARHSGGNSTWYHTTGDAHGRQGWVAAVNLDTPSAFDENPLAHGLVKCGGPPLPPSGKEYSVDAKGKLTCTNSAGAEIHASPSGASAVVDHLRTTYSWFDCWGTGALHSGGNTTWFHTYGDDHDRGGWVPAFELDTSSAIDANPSAFSVAKCSGQP